MYLKRLFFFLIFQTLFFNCFSQSKNIRSLTLDFTRTVKSENNSLDIVKGSIYYEKSPYSFVFYSSYPKEQTAWQNSEGSFFSDGNEIYDFSENAEILAQTCTDFITWFDADFGLIEQGYKPGKSCIEETEVVTEWNYTKTEITPVHHVLVSSISDNKITRLRMFSDEITCFADTSLLNFEQINGYFFPVKIMTVTTAPQGEVLETMLEFSNLKINNTPENKYKAKGTDPSEAKTITTGTDPSIKNASFSITPTSAASPSLPTSQSASFRVSIPSVLAGAGFIFYKKYITSQDMTNCPYTPSCSEYMLEAVTQNGIAGFFQGLDRLNRCTKFEHSRGFYEEDENHKHIDPVPVRQTKSKKEKQK